MPPKQGGAAPSALQVATLLDPGGAALQAPQVGMLVDLGGAALLALRFRNVP